MDTITISKRKVSRQIKVSSYINAERFAAKYFRFYDDRTEYTRGQLSITFDLTGKAIEGWSYWTCIFCYTEPTDDFPNGRLIYNQSGYGSTTGKHIGDMMGFFSSPAGSYTGPVTATEYRRVDKVIRTEHHEAYTYIGWDDVERTQPAYTRKITRPTRTYTSKRVVRPSPGDSQIEQICWGRGATPDRMREKVRLDARTAAQIAADEQAAIDAEEARKLRWAAMEAEWAAADAAADARNAERASTDNVVQLHKVGA